MFLRCKDQLDYLSLPELEPDRVESNPDAISLLWRMKKNYISERYQANNRMLFLISLTHYLLATRVMSDEAYLD